MDQIAAMRRSPAQCIYCSKAPTSNEHVVPEAIGGRLVAPILCDDHNGAVNRTADEPLVKFFAPWTNMLKVPRHRGQVGASFRARSVDGQDVMVYADGRVETLDRVTARDPDTRRIRRAEGQIPWLEHLAAQPGALASPSPIIALPGLPPVVNLAVGIDDPAHPGLVKMAIHFVVGFLADVNPEAVASLRGFVEGTKPVDTELLMLAPFEPPLFRDQWPPARHEITAYPNGTTTFVTLMLFGIFAVVIRLDNVAVPGTARYTQLLDGSPPSLSLVPPAAVGWEGLTQQRAREMIKGIHNRMERVYEHFQRAQHDEMCRAAARLAHPHYERTSNDEVFLDYFRAELQKYPWPSERVEETVEQMRAMIRNGDKPWAQ